LIRPRRPSEREIADALRAADAPFSYPEVGATAPAAPPLREALGRGYDVDRYAAVVGNGRAAFDRARDALAEWRHFDIPWLELHGSRRVETGAVVATVVRVAGVWLLSPCRVVYAELAPDAESACFAYGTLPGHALRGEERFRVFLDSATGEVRYEIIAFSRPAGAFATLGRPLGRRIQRRFAGASQSALRNAVSSSW
jgi:uncharacterized protein (UPF0548 family)